MHTRFACLAVKPFCSMVNDSEEEFLWSLKHSLSGFVKKTSNVFLLDIT